MKDEHGGIETVVKDDKEYGARKGLQLELAKGYFFNGVEYWSNTEYDLAMEEFEKVMEIREDFAGKNDESTAKALLWVGSIHWHRQEYEKAMDHFCRCFRVRMELTGSKQYCGIVTDWIDKVLEMPETLVAPSMLAADFGNLQRDTQLVNESAADSPVSEPGSLRMIYQYC